MTDAHRHVLAADVAQSLCQPLGDDRIVTQILRPVENEVEQGRHVHVEADGVIRGKHPRAGMFQSEQMHLREQRSDLLGRRLAQHLPELLAGRPRVQRDGARTFRRLHLEVQAAVAGRNRCRGREISSAQEVEEVQFIGDVVDGTPGLAPDAQRVLLAPVADQIDVVHAAIEQEASHGVAQRVAARYLGRQEIGVQHRMRDSGHRQGLVVHH